MPSHEAAPPTVRAVEFPEDTGSFVPARMEVMEASEARGSVPARVCLLGKDGVTYQVYSLPEGQILQA
jgi:anaphase-promoting complex subunit 4